GSLSHGSRRPGRGRVGRCDPAAQGCHQPGSEPAGSTAADLSAHDQRQATTGPRPRRVRAVCPSDRGNPGSNAMSKSMNEATHENLMKVVERAVRPLRAGTARKLAMREELLGHLTANYEEELARQTED